MKPLTSSDLASGSEFSKNHPRDWSRVWSHLETHYADRIRHRAEILDAMRFERNGDPYSPFVASAVSGMQTRAAKPWSPSWIYRLLADPDVTNPVTVSYQEPTVAPGTRAAYFKAHPEKARKARKVQSVEPMTGAAEAYDRLLALVGSVETADI